MLHAVHLEAVRLERAPLRERLLAQVALVRPDAGVGARVALQVERVVEALAAERAQVALHVTRREKKKKKIVITLKLRLV